jgi:hypothetical protein
MSDRENPKHWEVVGIQHARTFREILGLREWPLQIYLP